MSSDTALNFEPNSLYILLADRGADITFHWSFYLTVSSESGFFFHVLNSALNPNEWAYQTHAMTSTNVPSTVLLAVKVAVVEPVLHDALSERLGTVPLTRSPRYGDVTCRVWLKEALFVLDDEGYIKLTRDIELIENNAAFEAARNKVKRGRSVIKIDASEA
ncbi:hypothetical protein EDC01DRAFT_661397 [Geopyxis carbonaria]|nr:hypothetical protein EDC01DRAFT_661397 [Geopyxis carbonaria]